MPDATCLHHLRWRKKKVDGFIIPAKLFYGRVFELAVEDEEVVEAKIPEPKPVPNINQTAQKANDGFSDNNHTATLTYSAKVSEPKISAFSLKSIRAKKELELNSKSNEKEEIHLTEPFTETDMLLQWTKYAQRLGDRGQKIMESYLLISDPRLEGTTIIHELPNEGSKIDFETDKHNLLGYLRGKLHNHDITIDVVVNETIENKKTFSNQDRYNRLHEINPAIELLRNTFGLEISD